MKHYGLHVARSHHDERASLDAATRHANALPAEHLAEAKRLIEERPDARTVIDSDPGLYEVAKALGGMDAAKEVRTGLLNSHAFAFEGGIVDLLRETSAPDPERLPFVACFLDAEFVVPEVNKRVLGILVIEAREPRVDPPVMPESPALSVAMSLADAMSPPADFFIYAQTVPSDLPPGHYSGFLPFACNYRLPVDPLAGPSRSYGRKLVEFMGGVRNVGRMEKALREFVAAWAAMVNDPEVLVVETMKSPNARARAIREQGAAPQSSRVIRLTGVLRRYVQAQRDLAADSERRGVRAHWVRGHFKHLQAERYKAARGTTVWTPPHVRGVGAVLERTYEVRPAPAAESIQEAEPSA